MKTLRFLKQAAAPVLAAVLVLGASVGSAGSYFTTFVSAEGGYPLKLSQRRVSVNDEMDGNTKNITVTNMGEQECYVRVLVTAPYGVPVTYSGEGWMDGGNGYWYYQSPLQPGAAANTLYATIGLPTSSPERPIPEGTELKVSVLSECAPVCYDDETGAVKPNNSDYWEHAAEEGWR